MSRKALVMMGMMIGSTAGGFIPSLWGADFLSFWSVVTTAIGGILGIWLAFKITA